MNVDLLTLYLLATGTLLVAAGMMFWESRTAPRRRQELRTLAGGFATLAIGCGLVLLRSGLPPVAGAALSNLVILAGYLLVLRGVGLFSGRRYSGTSVVVLVSMTLLWIASGSHFLRDIWDYASSVPIAFVSGMTAWAMQRCDAAKSLPTRRIVVAVASIHALLYAWRACVLPWLVLAYGPALTAAAGKVTIYEGVLYSVLLPMALLKLTREETQNELLREAQTDYLTRLGNRKWFFEEGARIIEARNRQGPLAVLAFDLDHFKSINDAYGHPTGDEVLTLFARIARTVLGPEALLARMGGEEFAALLPGPAARNARALGEAVANRLTQTTPMQIDRIAIPTTVSIGLVQYENEVPSLIDGLAAADEALYRAKSLGGNRLESTSLTEALAAH
jgi:diguanylate cyclase (GGDEF)-like protein